MRARGLIMAPVALIASSTVSVITALASGEQIGMLPTVLLAHVLLAACFMFAEGLREPVAESVPEAPAPLDESARVDGVAQRYGLSRREHEVLEVYVRNRDIRLSANELFIAPGTVKTHLSHMYAKTGVNGCDELLRLCDGFPSYAPSAQAA